MGQQGTTAEWHLGRDGERFGPYSTEQVAELARQGRIAATDLMWTQGMVSWQPASTLTGLFPAGTTFNGPPMADDRATRWMLPVGRSGWAIAAGYLGLFAVLVIPAPFALIIGIIGIVDIKQHPGLHGMGRAVFGTVMGAVFSVLLVLAIVFS